MRLMVENVSAHRGDELIFDAISFSLSSGEGMAVTGPNGSGKSTLLRVLAGLLPLSTGTVRTQGLNEAAGETLRTSMHFINALNAMKPALSVAENLLFWQAFHGKPWMDTRDALAQFGMGHVHDVPFSDLSTGQRRRVNLSRLFLNKRPLWLLDEPTSGLDTASERVFAAHLKTHIDDGGLFIAATHLPLGEAASKTLRFQATGG